MFFRRVRHQLARNIPSQIQHRIAVVFQQYPDDVLADVVNVALYRCQDDLATADRGGIAFDEGGLDTSNAACATLAVWISWGRKILPCSNSFPALSSAGIRMSLTTSMASVVSSSCAVIFAPSFFSPWDMA